MACLSQQSGMVAAQPSGDVKNLITEGWYVTHAIGTGITHAHYAERINSQNRLGK